MKGNWFSGVWTVLTKISLSIRESSTERTLTPALTTIAPRVTLWNSEWTISIRGTLKISIEELESSLKKVSKTARFEPDLIFSRNSTFDPSTVNEFSVTLDESTIWISIVEVSTWSRHSGQEKSPEREIPSVTFLNEISNASSGRVIKSSILTSWPIFSNLKTKLHEF